MSGLFTVYYTIKPTDELNQIILQMDAKIDYSWLKPRVWFNEETTFGDINYSTNIVKIAFLLEIISQQNWFKEDIIELVFGKPPQFSISTFNRLWEIERFESGAESWKVMMKAKGEHIKLIQMTGDSAIDKMLMDAIQYKEETTLNPSKESNLPSFERVDGIAFCGENPQIMLYGETGENYSAAASYWRSVYSPFGEGNVLLLYLDEANSKATEHPSYAIYSDNLPLAEYLTLTFNQHFDEYKGLKFGEVKPKKASFKQESDSRNFHRVKCETAAHHIELNWSDVRLRQLFILKDLNEGGFGKAGDEHYDVYTNIFTCAHASIKLNGHTLSGTIRTKQDGDIFRSSAFMAFSETWIKRT